MAKLVTYTQCRLQKANIIDVVWIPSRFAKKGNFVAIKKDGEWEDGWEVKEVGSYRKPSKYVLGLTQEYKSLHTYATRNKKGVRNP